MCEHPTLGMKFEMCSMRNRPKLMDMEKGTPAARTPRWRSSIRYGVVISIDDNPVTSNEDIESIMAHARQNKMLQVNIIFAVDKYHGLHPIDSNPIVYWDQLNVISKINHDINMQAEIKRRL
jgi:hypothetical protein